MGTAPPPDVKLIDALMLPTLVRRLTADLENRQLSPEVAAFVAIRLPVVGREAVVVALLKHDIDAAVRALRAIAIQPPLRLPLRLLGRFQRLQPFLRMRFCGRLAHWPVYGSGHDDPGHQLELMGGDPVRWWHRRQVRALAVRERQSPVQVEELEIAEAQQAHPIPPLDRRAGSTTTDLLAEGERG